MGRSIRNFPLDPSARVKDVVGDLRRRTVNVRWYLGEYIGESKIFLCFNKGTI